MRKSLYALLIIVLCCGLFLFAGCSETEQEQKPTKVVVTLDWTPNTNHTGLFVAKEEGYFDDAGLEVEIIQLSGGTVEQVVATGASHFGVSYQEAVTYARASDIPVVSIAAIIQSNTSGFASLKSKNIETPKDFEGKRYGGWGSPVEEATIKALMEPFQADFEKVEILTTGAVDFFVSSEKNADFSWIFFGWDGVAAEIMGIELNYIELGTIDPALDYYTPVLITSEQLIEKDPEVVERFMEAVSKGYEFAIDYPDEAAEVLLKNAPELDRDLVIASQKWLKDKYQEDAPYWGYQEHNVWERYAIWLYERDLIDALIDVAPAYTNDFLSQ